MLLWSEDWIRTLYATSFNSLIPRRFLFCSNEWWNTLASRVELEFPCAVLWEVWSVFSDKQQETTEWISKSNIFFLSTSLIILKKIKSKQESWSIPPSPFLYPSSLLSFFHPPSSRPSQYTDTAKQTVRLKYLRIFFNHFHILQIINIQARDMYIPYTYAGNLPCTLNKGANLLPQDGKDLLWLRTSSIWEIQVSYY